ncbi:MAG TPA: hypothetical protein VF329_15180 [Gammaproteobacteria bacterium]
MDRDRHEGKDEGTERTEGRHESGRPAEAGPESKPRRRGNRHHTARRKNRPKPAAARGGQSASGREPNTQQMRKARASGRTPGISTADEPAAAPLGTDDEAAGTRTSPHAVEQEIDRAEAGRGMHGLTADEAMSGRPGRSDASPRVFGKLVTIAAAVIVVVILWALFF